MSPDRWRRVQEIFNAVADLPPEAREAALEREASGDETLREEVEVLLRAEAGAKAFFQSLSGALPEAPAVEFPPPEAEPLRFVQKPRDGGTSEA